MMTYILVERRLKGLYLLVSDFNITDQKSLGGKMSCLKGKSQVKKKEAKVTCEKCGAVAKKKDQVCKPVKVKPKKEKSENKKN
jgi:hypothetical protein